MDTENGNLPAAVASPQPCEKAISLWQPWALLWLLSDPDEKVFETRGPNGSGSSYTGYTSYRGPLLVHAAKKQDGDVREFMAAYRPLLIEALWDRHGIRIEELAYGAIIGRVNLIGCCRMDRIPEPSDRERSWGKWEPNRYAWERGSNPEIFAIPIPYRGAQGFFNVPSEVLQGERLRHVAGNEVMQLWL